MLRVKTSISMPPALLKVANKRARKEGRTRSAVIQDAVRQYERHAEKLDRLFAYGEQKANELGVTEEDIIRIMREVRNTADRRRTKV